MEDCRQKVEEGHDDTGTEGWSSREKMSKSEKRKETLHASDWSAEAGDYSGHLGPKNYTRGKQLEEVEEGDWVYLWSGSNCIEESYVAYVEEVNRKKEEVAVRWMYRFSDLNAKVEGPVQGYPLSHFQFQTSELQEKELIWSDHIDTNPFSAINGFCKVVKYNEYESSITDMEDHTFFFRYAFSSKLNRLYCAADVHLNTCTPKENYPKAEGAFTVPTKYKSQQTRKISKKKKASNSSAKRCNLQLLALSAAESEEGHMQKDEFGNYTFSNIISNPLRAWDHLVTRIEKLVQLEMLDENEGRKLSILASVHHFRLAPCVDFVQKHNETEQSLVDLLTMLQDASKKAAEDAWLNIWMNNYDFSLADTTVEGHTPGSLLISMDLCGRKYRGWIYEEEYPDHKTITCTNKVIPQTSDQTCEFRRS